MKEKVVGIDMGTGSLGILLTNLELGDNIIDQLEWFSVTTFNAGTGMSQTGEYTLASDRRSHIQSRRLKEHSRWKRWATLALLLEYDMCPMKQESLEKWSVYDKNRNLQREYPVDDQAFAQWLRLDFNGDGIPDYTSPFQLRRELIEKQLDFSLPENRYKLGRAIYHIALHRGFKSSKGETLAELEEGSKDASVSTDDIDSAMKKSEEKKSKDLTEYTNHGDRFLIDSLNSYQKPVPVIFYRKKSGSLAYLKKNPYICTRFVSCVGFKRTIITKKNYEEKINLLQWIEEELGVHCGADDVAQPYDDVGQGGRYF